MDYYERVIRMYPEKIDRILPEDTASLGKPTICGYFSIDKDRRYVDDMSNMKYYYPRNQEIEQDRLKLDLNVGIEIVVRKPENVNEKINHLLNFILQNANKLLDTTNSGKLLEADFVCFRGLLTNILCSLHLNEEWTIYATRWRGTIYLCAVKAEQKPYPGMNKFCSWGYKFEQYMMTDKPGIPPDTSKPVCEAEEFCCMFKSKLKSNRLLYGAEMDGIISNTEITGPNQNWDEIEFVELKTSRQVYNRNDKNNLENFKFIKWWAQSFLSGVQQVHCGFRDNNGIVRNITKFSVRDLPNQQNYWNWRNCLNFLDIFLDLVKNTIPKTTDDPHSVWKFTWVPNQYHFKCDEISGRSEYSFLPSWYIDNMKKVSLNL